MESLLIDSCYVFFYSNLLVNSNSVSKVYDCIDFLTLVGMKVEGLNALINCTFNFWAVNDEMAKGKGFKNPFLVFLL